MEVKHGWTGEVLSGTWRKVDVTVNDLDLLRVLVGAGIEIAPERVPLSIAWQILDAEAERFILVKLVRAHGYPQEQAKPRLIELAQTLSDLLAKVRALADA